MLLTLAAAGGFLFRQGVGQRRRAVAETCPLCLGHDCLEPEPPAAGRRAAAAATIKCRNVISRHPREECNYAFAAAYQSMEKLCFPTLGVPQAGKTHWLAMLYWELNRGQLSRARCSSKSQVADLRGFRHPGRGDPQQPHRHGRHAARADPPSPGVQLPRPRPLGPSNLLVNIFDYSGEVTADMGVEDYRRRRALEADGYFFFLDPTFPTEPQAKALADFREDLRLVKA